MNKIKIAEGVYWVGAIDWNARSLHGGNYTAHHGTSYNAYLIIDEKITLVDEYTNSLKRLQADFENYIKRTEKEKQELMQLANYKLIMKLLTIIDDFEASLKVIKKEGNKDVIEGIEMVFNNLYKVLEAEGVKPINVNGEKFDPYKHEAIDKVISNEHEEGLILEEIKKGYTYQNKIIRPSMVKIAIQEERK